MQPIGSSRSKKELVIATLRNAILNGELTPGTRLVIDDLARQLGVSPIPVREALQQLDADGYVAIEPYLGARVTPIEAESVVEVFSLLEIMEVISSRAACQRMSEEDFAVLEQILLKMDSLAGDPELWSQENRHFHKFICDKSGTRLVGSLMSKVLDHWDRLHRYFLKDVFARRLPQAQREHWKILSALRTRDPAETEAAIRRHTQASLSAYAKHLSIAGAELVAPPTGKARLPTPRLFPLATSGQQGRHSSASAERRRASEPGKR
jgi:DNA-binding GntR family transcriptional regulator